MNAISAEPRPRQNFPPMLLFDCHLDLAMNALEWNRDLRWSLEKIRRHETLGSDRLPGRKRGTVSLPELRRGRIAICVATQIARYTPPFGKLPGWCSPEQAWAQTQGQLAWYRAMEECGEMVMLRTWADAEAHLARWNAATAGGKRAPADRLLSLLEGADSILSWRHLERSRAEGLIALGPVHYGPGIYGHGTDDEGPLPPRGRELLREMERLGLILDVTHLCDESFWDALARFSGPLWASHSNCRALANWNRQFDDRQILALIERGAVIGMAFDAIMMVHGWVHRRLAAAGVRSADREDLRAHRPHLPARRERAARRPRLRSGWRLRRRADADGLRYHRRSRAAA